MEIREAESGSKLPLALAAFSNVHINLKETLQTHSLVLVRLWGSGLMFSVSC